jgi:Astacin (Peptidase family M12A)
MKWKLLTIAASLIAVLAACQSATPQSETGRVPFRYSLANGNVYSGTGVQVKNHILAGKDILLPLSAAQNTARLTPQANVTYDTWWDGVIPYVFDASVSENMKARVLEAFNPWRGLGVRIRPRTTETQYLTIRSYYDNFYIYSWQCASVVGMRMDNNNQMYANDGCRRRDLVHEWGHAMGLFHEHTRPDRDNYVALSSYDEIKGSSFGAYDFDSVMHYDAYNRNIDGSIDYNSIFIQPLDGRPLNSFGFNEAPSNTDRVAIRTLYPRDTEPPCRPICP